MSRLNPYVQKFTEQYPESGEVKRGNLLTGEQASQFSGIIAGEITKLSRKEELSVADKNFVDRTAMLSARTINWLTERGKAVIPESVAKDNLHKAVHAIDAQASEDREGLAYGLNALSQGAASLRNKPELRMQVEDAAVSAVTVLGEMIQNRGSIELDQYTADSMQNIIANFEMTQ